MLAENGSAENVIEKSNSRCSDLPLTQAQKYIWLGQQMDKKSPAYNVASYISLEGSLDYLLLQSALSVVISETDSLRTLFYEKNQEEGEVYQQIQNQGLIDLQFVDLRNDREPLAEAEMWMEKDLQIPIDLGSHHLFSTALICLSEKKFFWYFKTHHIILDGFGISLFYQRVQEVYSSLLNHTEISKNPFRNTKDILDEELKYRLSDNFKKDRDYWIKKCENTREVPSFTHSVALPIKTSVQYKDKIPTSDFKRLQELGEELSTHWVHVLAAAFSIFLNRTTNQNNLIIGVPFLNRSGPLAVRSLTTTANVLPLSVSMKPSDLIVDVIKQVSLGFSEMSRHQRYRSEDIRRDCHLIGEGRRLMGPQINFDLFSVQLHFGQSLGIPHLLSAGPADDISFVIQANAEKDVLRLIGLANPTLYKKSELQNHIQNFLSFLKEFAKNLYRPIGQLDAFSEAELYLLKKSYEIVPHQNTSQETLIHVFEKRVKEFPDAVALVFNEETLSYRCLNERANQLAKEIIRTHNIKGNPFLVLLLPRSLETVIAILASLKLGAAYVPIDPDLPENRIATIINDTQPLLILTDMASSSKLKLNFPILMIDEKETLKRIRAQSADNLSASHGRFPSPDDLAYVIYTSGSTGKPKGVKITHYNVLRLFSSTHHWFDYRQTDVWANCHSYIFDASVWEMWGALLHGAKLVIVPPEVTRAPEQLLALIVKEKVSVFGQIPSAFYRFMELELERPELSAQLCLRYQCFGGEALDLARLKPWFSRERKNEPKLLNMYGITETTINLTYQFIDKAQVFGNSGSLIGKTYDDCRIMILDDALRPVPIGGYGEIYVSGEGLAQGYLNRPDLDALRFLANPYGAPGSRMYRSGDVGRLQENKVLEYLGRADQQVKLRGYRIELGEIEAHLRQHPAILDAVASVRSDSVGDSKLLAHVILQSEFRQQENFDLNAFRRYLSDRLPTYMVPSAIGVMDAFPLTPNGKVDRKALPEIQLTSYRHIEPPRDEIDRSILDVWSAQLQIEKIGIDDNFFDIGGDSIKAIRICRSLNIPVIELFDNPTPRASADFIRFNGATQKNQNFIHPFKKKTGKEKINLICVPFAGGNPTVFREFFEHLSADFSCYSINLPGHDVATFDNQFLSLGELAEESVKEIVEQIQGPIIVYGHCAGNALAIAISRKLEDYGANLVELIIGGMLPDEDPANTLDHITQKTGRQIIDFLRGLGGFQDELDEETLDIFSKMTKHDSQEAGIFFATEAKNPRKLKAPIHVIVGDEDPLTADYPSRYASWASFSQQVSLSVIKGGGHYFVTKNPAQLAEIIEQGFSEMLKNLGGFNSKLLREFKNPFDEEDEIFYLLKNHKGHMSLWPAFSKIPEGWVPEYGPASRRDCLAFF